MDCSSGAGAPPLIYNLFSRLVGSVNEWAPHFERAATMGFDWIYLNPVFFPGFSGSLYSVKDFQRLDPVICPPETTELPLSALGEVIDRARQLGLKVMVDLVINHTAKDSPLVESHPEWYCRDESGEVLSPFAIDPADARRKTVWGDLAELDYEGTSDPGGLAAFVDSIVDACLEVGFEGFRCDAAYKVPAATWERVMGRARARRPEALFLAENLGCRPAEMDALEGAGFDLVMNSSKYWAFDAPWALEQHADWQRIAPSVSFPESHDTPRLAAETGGLERVQRQRLVLAAVFSRGLLLPVGFEYGFERSLDVVETRPGDWEEPRFDLQVTITDLLRLKRSRPALALEGSFREVTPLDRPTLVLEKSADDDRVVLLINKDWHQPQEIDLDEASRALGSAGGVIRPCLDQFEPSAVGAGGPFRLEPAEIALLVAG